jgi:RNA polymerase sigma-70 factor (ECF subfamily)
MRSAVLGTSIAPVRDEQRIGSEVMTDLELVERARSGDHDAFAALVRSASGRLYGTAKLILRDAELAEDAVQEALMLAWRNFGALRAAGAWQAWLYRLTVRECQRLAASQRRRTIAEAAVVHADPAEPDFSRSVDDRDRMGRELARLPLEQRTVLVLHFYLDLPLTDAAAILDVPVGTAKSRLNRGLEAMRAGVAAGVAPLPIPAESRS